METLITWITALIAAASAIANVTPSLRDNEWLESWTTLCRSLPSTCVKRNDRRNEIHR